MFIDDEIPALESTNIHIFLEDVYKNFNWGL